MKQKQDDKIISKFTPAARQLLQSTSDRLILIHVFFSDRSGRNMDLCKTVLNSSGDGFVLGYGCNRELGRGSEHRPAEESYPSSSFVHSSRVDVYASWEGAKKLADLNNVVHIALTQHFISAKQKRGADGEYPHRIKPFHFPERAPHQHKEVLVAQQF